MYWFSFAVITIAKSETVVGLINIILTFVSSTLRLLGSMEERIAPIEIATIIRLQNMAINLTLKMYNSAKIRLNIMKIEYWVDSLDIENFFISIVILGTTGSLTTFFSVTAAETLLLATSFLSSLVIGDSFGISFDNSFDSTEIGTCGADFGAVGGAIGFSFGVD